MRICRIFVNTGNQPGQAVATFDLNALGQPADLAACDVLADKPIPCAAGQMQLSLEPL